MINYTPSNQLTLEGFSQPFENELSLENRWVKLAEVVPWDELAIVYANSLDPLRGRESLDIRLVIAAIIIKHKLQLDDRGTVHMISENLYLQYFSGLRSFQVKPPFHPTVFVDIRKRMGAASFDNWNELIIEKADGLKPKKERMVDKGVKGEGTEGDTGNGKPETGATGNKGTLKIDATVADQEIAYPTDTGLLNKGRLETERLIDQLHAQSGLPKKPRTYRRKASQSYLAFSKKRGKSKKSVRKERGRQLNYLHRNIKSIEKLLDHIEATNREKVQEGLFPEGCTPFSQAFPLCWRDQRIYWVVREIYRQQRFMHDNKVNSVGNRIVNIYQPYVRPIVRGKDKAKVEFGAKISSSECGGMARVEHIGWEAFNESTDLKLQVNLYKTTYGHWPDLLLADRVYLNRENRKWLKLRNIRVVGPPLGRPPKEKPSAYQRRKRKKERNQRNLIEGKFGQGKRAYGLNNIRAKRQDTSESWISAIFFVMNLVTLGKIAEKYAIFCASFEKRWQAATQWIAFLFFAMKRVPFNTKLLWETGSH